jgi:hypothetical protein
MKTLLIIFALAASCFAARPAWVDSKETTWKDSGKVYILIHVTNKDLDHGMSVTEARFRDVIADNFCPESPCVYHNFTREGSFWEMVTVDGNFQTFEIYRLFSIKDTSR